MTDWIGWAESGTGDPAIKNVDDLVRDVILTSGRYDLVVDTTNFDDNGIFRVIDRAIDELDGMVVLPDFKYRHIFQPTAGQEAEVIRYLRSVEMVMLASASGSTQLWPADLRYIILQNTGVTSTNDEPKWYALDTIRIDPMQESDDISSFHDVGTIKQAVGFSNYTGIRWTPKAKAGYTMQVYCLLECPDISNAAQSNPWIARHYNAIFQACMMKLEEQTANEARYNFWLARVSASVEKIRKDNARLETPREERQIRW